MTGKEYLENIRDQLKLGHNQNRMGEKVLRAFGYVRRRATAIQEINAKLEDLGLSASPAIDSQMPLRSPRIIFSLKSTNEAATTGSSNDPGALSPNGFATPLQDEEDTDGSLPELAFSISELTSAKKDVAWVTPDSSIQKAYTIMLQHKYSQLVVASHASPRQQDIKGIVSFQSMAKALMNGKPTAVGDCIDEDVSCAPVNTDLTAVLSQLSRNDVVLVIGLDKRLQGIVTAWDLAEEFTQLVDPFRRIGEIEERLRTLIRRGLGNEKVAMFLRDAGLSGDDPIAEVEELTMGDLQRVLDDPEHWDALKLAFDRVAFIHTLGEVRGYRNRLMHFKDSLNEGEIDQLTNFCDIVREIQL